MDSLFVDRPDLSKSCVQVLGAADVQHQRSKVLKSITQLKSKIEKEESKDKPSRLLPLKIRQLAFWERVQNLFDEEFAAEIEAYNDPRRLEQCEKKRLARRKRKAPSSSDAEQMEEEEGH